MDQDSCPNCGYWQFSEGERANPDRACPRCGLRYRTQVLVTGDHRAAAGFGTGPAEKTSKPSPYCDRQKPGDETRGEGFQNLGFFQSFRKFLALAGPLRWDRTDLFSLIKITLILGSVVWITAFLSTDVNIEQPPVYSTENYSWDFREALVLFLFGLAAALALGAAILYLGAFLTNFLGDSFRDRGQPTANAVFVAGAFLVFQLISFAGIPSLKTGIVRLYRNGTTLAERSTYNVERDTLMRERLKQLGDHSD